MGAFQFQPKFLAALIVAFLLLPHFPAPATSALLPYGDEKIPSMAFNRIFGSRKMEGGREGFSFRILRSRLPSPPPAPTKNRATSMRVLPPPLVQ